ncbi:hypothetical protein ABZO31_02335 [Streptomyces sp. HUAS MG47]
MADLDVAELPHARHFIQEHAPDAIAAAIARRFLRAPRPAGTVG